MLSDDFIAAKSQKTGPNQPAFIQAAKTAVADKIEAASRFVLERPATFMVQSLSRMPLRSALAALKICRLPHPRMWVEFAYQDRADWEKEAGVDLYESDTAVVPSRLGFYIEEADADGNIISIQPCWSHKQHPAEVALKHILISIGGDPIRPTEELIAIRRRLHTPEGRAEALRDFSSKPSIDEIFEVESRIAYTVPSYMQAFWDSAKGDEQRLEQMERTAAYDCLIEWRFVVALLTMLNSRNVISYGDEPDLTKLNKVRAKKGNPPLLAHRSIKLNLSKVQANRVRGLGGSRAEAQAHLVRGHWKLRNGQLYWWSPHARGGTDEAPSTRTYHVTA